MYKAKIDIGEFKKGEVVPEEQALLWISMYKESPVEKFTEVKKPEEKDTIIDKVVDILDDGKLNNSHKKNKKSKWSRK